MKWKCAIVFLNFPLMQIRFSQSGWNFPGLLRSDVAPHKLQTHPKRKTIPGSWQLASCVSFHCNYLIIAFQLKRSHTSNSSGTWNSQTEGTWPHSLVITLINCWTNTESLRLLSRCVGIKEAPISSSDIYQSVWVNSTDKDRVSVTITLYSTEQAEGLCSISSFN